MIQLALFLGMASVMLAVAMMIVAGVEALGAKEMVIDD
jgi:hypothetical protein